MDDVGLYKIKFTEKIDAFHPTSIKKYVTSWVIVHINSDIINDAVKTKPCRLQCPVLE